jgi:sugar (pentulose or hexulose) kinase
MDQVCAAVAAGNIRPGIVTESTGSVLALLATTDRPVFDPVTKISCYTHAVPGAYCLIPWNPTGGLVLKWFKDRFGEVEQERARGTGVSAYDLLCEAAAAVPPGCDGLVMLPHLQGVLFPEINPGARGAFFGFTLSHGRAHFTRAILEAIAFMLRDGLGALKGLGVEAGQVCVLGGGARSRLWSQIKADVCQLPLTVPRASEAALQGAAMLAGVGAGVFPDVAAAAEAMVHVTDRIEPDPALADVYDRAYHRYRKLYEQLRPLF